MENSLNEVSKKETLEKETKTENDTVVDNKTDIYSRAIDVPSNGYLGGPKQIVIRPMTAAEEKILYSSKDFSFITKIVRACTISPENIDMYKLLPEDLLFILYRIRELTFGPKYNQPVRCENCGTKQDAEINIDSFEYTLLPDDVDEKLLIELPISKLKVRLKLLSKGELDDLEKEVIKSTQKENIKDPDGYMFIKRLMSSVESIDGKEFDSERDKYQFFMKMHALDVNEIRNTINSIKFGLDTSTTVTCSSCGEDIEVIGSFCPEFFRPTK